jgi:hypothetical protein
LWSRCKNICMPRWGKALQPRLFLASPSSTKAYETKMLGWKIALIDVGQ